MREAVKVSQRFAGAARPLPQRRDRSRRRLHLRTASDVLIGGIMEHIEQAGVHSGDSACSLPPYSLSETSQDELRARPSLMAQGAECRRPDERAVRDPDSVIGETVLAAHFPAGAGQPVVVIGNQGAAAALRAAFAATPGIAGVTPPAARAGHAYLEGTLTSPPDSAAAYATIDRVRAAVHTVRGADAKVGGNTAINLDVQRASAHDRNLIIPLILAVVFIILALLLRASWHR